MLMRNSTRIEFRVEDAQAILLGFQAPFDAL